jgi:short-subunit dehydrogenase
MTQIKNKKVLITGGLSGIGKLMGEMVLQRGGELVIWDIDQSKMDAVVAELSKIGKTSAYLVDVSDSEQVKLKAAEVLKNHGNIDILINNAGIVIGKFFHQHNAADIARTMSINTSALMWVALGFLPGMMEQNSGHICNIASSAGLISNPRMSVYAASKWAVIGWSDSLRIEMKQLKKNVGITTVTPYYIDTGMFAGVRSLVPILKPEKVARKIIRAIERNRIVLSMPWSMHFVRFAQGILPIPLFDFVVGRLMGIYKTMEHFTGRKG